MSNCGGKWVLVQGLIWSLAGCAVAPVEEASRFRSDDVPSEEETDESSTGGVGNRNAFAKFESGRLRFQCSEQTAARIPGSGAELMANLSGFLEESQYAVLVNAATSDGASISADALVAPGLAAQLGAPVLMAERTALPEVTRDELTRLGTSNIIIVGGTAVIGDVVEDELRRDGLTVYRIAGADRFETAVAVAKEMVVGIGLSRLDNAQMAAQAGEANQAVLVNGANVIDGLAAVAASARYRSPLVYTHTDRLDDATIALFSDAYLEFDRVDVIGGVAAISDAVQREVGEILHDGTTRRLAGPSRYDSAVAVAQAVFTSRTFLDEDRPVFVIDGTNPIYELAAATFGAAVLLSERDTLHPAVRGFISQHADCAMLVGDQLSDQVLEDAQRSLEKTAVVPRFWTNSGVWVEAGDEIAVEAEGTWTSYIEEENAQGEKVGAHIEVGPEGGPADDERFKCKVGELLYRVGIFGPQRCYSQEPRFVAQHTGFLGFGTDRPRAGDRGRLFVTIHGGTRTPPPGAVPLVPAPANSTEAFAERCAVSVIYENLEFGGNGDIFHQSIADPEQFVQDISKRACAALYKDPSEVPPLESIKLQIFTDETKPAAYATNEGSREHAVIFLNGTLLQLFRERRANVRLELEGTLLHELVHVHQHLGESWLHEGVADLVRLREALHSPAHAQRALPDESYTDGYLPVGFFLYWLEQRTPDLVYQLNLRGTTVPALEELAGGSVDDLWAEYQAALFD